jgi:formylglycine-generating enzyme required for sulfatase activity
MKSITHRLLTACAVVISISAPAQGATRYTPDGDAYNYDDGYVLVDSSGNAGGYTRYWGYDNSSQIVNGLLVLHRQLNLTEVLVDKYSFPTGYTPPPAPYEGRFSGLGPPIVASPFSSTIVPILGIVPAGNQTILFWPSIGNGTNCVLQSTTNLASPNWVPATDTLAVAYGSQTAVSVTNFSAARFFRLSLAPPTSDGMALIPGGSFTMGNSIGDSDITDATPTNVYVSAFYMDKNLVSYSQWQSVYSWATNNGYSFDDVGSGKSTNHPVQTVDWYDCVKWCNARSQQAELIPIYYTDSAFTQVYTNEDVDEIYPNWEANGYRLPTEAEWEKAARGGLSGLRFPWGNTISENEANYYGYTGYSYDLGPNGLNTAFDIGADPDTSPVGYFAPNNFGLYDMAGNVSAWCWDWYGTPYGQPTASNPTGASTGSDRVLRGGYWLNFADITRCGCRNYNYPESATSYWGFRCVRGF